MPTTAELDPENSVLRARGDTLASAKGSIFAAVLLSILIIVARVISMYMGIPGLPNGSVAKIFVIFFVLFLIGFPLFWALFFGHGINMKGKLSHFFTPAVEVSTSDASEIRTSSKGQ
jgi:phosphoglycerol transferase MdoB-like AlkP superfamily enzyme